MDPFEIPVGDEQEAHYDPALVDRLVDRVDMLLLLLFDQSLTPRIKEVSDELHDLIVNHFGEE